MSPSIVLKPFVISLIPLKIQKKLASLRKMPWSEEKKAMVEVVIKSPTYTSSDESDFSGSESGESHLAGYLVETLPWERSALTKAKKALDDAYIRSLNPRSRVNLMRRDAHERFSARHLPPNGPKWPVRTEEVVPTLRTAATPSTGPPPEVTASHRAYPTTATLFEKLKTTMLFSIFLLTKRQFSSDIGAKFLIVFCTYTHFH